MASLPSNIPNTPVVQEIMKRFVTDADFRADVLDDPEEALKEAGFEDVPPELIEHFEDLDPDEVEQQIAQMGTDEGGTC